jgi:hypothetical protein
VVELSEPDDRYFSVHLSADGKHRKVKPATFTRVIEQTTRKKSVAEQKPKKRKKMGKKRAKKESNDDDDDKLDRLFDEPVKSKDLGASRGLVVDSGMEALIDELDGGFDDEEEEFERVFHMTKRERQLFMRNKTLAILDNIDESSGSLLDGRESMTPENFADTFQRTMREHAAEDPQALDGFAIDEQEGGETLEAIERFMHEIDSISIEEAGRRSSIKFDDGDDDK